MRAALACAGASWPAWGVLALTQVHATQYVGKGLNCTSCHLDGGRTPHASPWVGIWGVFPEYRTRNATVNALQDRVNDCFRRSMNGKALPMDSPEMRAKANDWPKGGKPPDARY